MELKGSTMVTVTTPQVSTTLEGEAVVLDLSRGVYYGLPGVGALVWDRIQRPTSIDDLVVDITAEYSVDAAQCREDLVTLLGEMIDRGLARTVDEQTP